MVFSVASSIYNAPSIYESGAGGGGSEGEIGTGSVILPTGYKRLLYLENEKNYPMFNCTFNNKEVNKDCSFEFVVKFPNFIVDSASAFMAFYSADNSLRLDFRDWTNGFGSTYFDARFFGQIIYGSTINNISNQTIKVTFNKEGLFFNDNKIASLSPSSTSVINSFNFPNMLQSELNQDDVYIYKFLVRKENQYIYDCLPVIREDDNKIGFFDFVDEQFYECKSSIAGPLFPY